MSRRVVLVAGIALGALVLGGAAVLVLGRGGGATPTAALAAPRFVDQTAASGIDHVYDGDVTAFTGGGVAVLDCDADGRPDVYLPGGDGPAALYRNGGPPGGDLAFTRIEDPATDLREVAGAYPLDVDGDGRVDLAVLRVGEVVMLRGLGDCRFERANEAWGIDGGSGWATAFSATWERDATLPTLAFGAYQRLDPSGAPAFECDESRLLRPDPAGARYAAAIPLAPGYCTLSMLFSDWDRSGRRDLRVTNDRQYYVEGQDQLWRVEAGAPPRLYTDRDGWVALQVWGMGIASYDVTGDGFPDVYVTSQGDNKLQTLTAGPAQPAYRDIALRRGVTASQPFTGGDALPSTAWHPEFQDVNNDGFIDLFVSKGNVSAMPEFATRDPSNLLLGQPDGTFREGADAAGIVDFQRARGAALADFDLDGLLDLVVVNLGTPVRLWRNVGAGDGGSPSPMGHWLAVRAHQPGPNADAIGAWIEVRVGDRVLLRELTVGGGHIGGQLGPAHFGLGPATEASVRVTWPDGDVGPWLPVTADQAVAVERGAGEAVPWQPAGD